MSMHTVRACHTSAAVWGTEPLHSRTPPHLNHAQLKPRRPSPLPRTAAARWSLSKSLTSASHRCSSFVSRATSSADRLYRCLVVSSPCLAARYSPRSASNVSFTLRSRVASLSNSSANLHV